VIFTPENHIKGLLLSVLWFLTWNERSSCFRRSHFFRYLRLMTKATSFQILDRKHPFFIIYLENECFTFSYLDKLIVYRELTFGACFACFGPQAQNTQAENGFEGNFMRHSPPITRTTPFQPPKER
jgi:hypothetical protein